MLERQLVMYMIKEQKNWIKSSMENLCLNICKIKRVLTSINRLAKVKTADQRRYRTADVRPSSRDIKKLFGNGMRLSGGACEMCGSSMNDKFIFADASL